MNLAWESGYSMGVKFVLVTLCDMASDEGVCYPSVATLARKCSMSERTIQGHINALESDGALSRKFRSGTSTVYYIYPRRFCTPAESAPPQNLHPTPAELAGVPPQNLHPTPAESAPRTVSEPSSEPSGEPGGVSAEVGGELNGSEKRQQDEPLPSASPVDDIRLGGLCRRLRVCGVDAAPHLLKHPDWQALLAKHSDEVIVGAAELARDRKPNERLSLGYLVPMLNQPPKPPPRGSPVGGQRQSRADRNAAFFEQLGVGNGRGGEASGAIDGSARRVG